MTENQPARQDIYLRGKDGGTDVMSGGGVTGWPVPVTDNDLRLLLARLLEREGARYQVHGDGEFTRTAGPDTGSRSPRRQPPGTPGR